VDVTHVTHPSSRFGGESCVYDRTGKPNGSSLPFIQLILVNGPIPADGRPVPGLKGGHYVTKGNGAVTLVFRGNCPTSTGGTLMVLVAATGVRVDRSLAALRALCGA
jgi:hypothetical protein